MFFDNSNFENLKLFTLEVKKADLTTQELNIRNDIAFNQINQLILNFSSVQMSKKNIKQFSKYFLNFSNLI